MAVTQTGFLGNIDSAYNVESEKVPSAFLTEQSLDPVYQVHSIQEDPTPGISVGGGTDSLADNSLGKLIALTTDPDIRKKREEEEEKRRAAIARGGGAAALFATEPGVDITMKGFEAFVPKFDIDAPRVALETFGGSPSADITKRLAEYGLDQTVELPKRPVSDPWTSTTEQTGQLFAGHVQSELETQFLDVSGEFLGNLYSKYLEPTVDPYLQQAKGFVDPYVQRAKTSFIEPFKEDVASTFDPITGEIKYYGQKAQNIAGDAERGISKIFTGTAAPSSTLVSPVTGIAGKGYGPPVASTAGSASSLAAGSGQVANITTKGYGATAGAGGSAASGMSLAQVGGTALAAYGAYDSFKQGDTVGGVINTGMTIALATGNGPVALALGALSFARSLGFGRGKPKVGMGGSEIRFDENTGTLVHSDTWSYNGFDPSGVKRHTDLARNAINNYMKAYNVKLDPKKVPLDQWHNRIDASPYRNGSQSASELIERWLSSGAFIGNPSVYDAYTGTRQYFNSQEQYEQSVQNFLQGQFANA